MTEADTETFKIEPKLKEAGWNVIPASRFTKNFAITPGEIRSDGERKHPKRADYVLIYKNRKLGERDVLDTEKAYDFWLEKYTAEDHKKINKIITTFINSKDYCINISHLK